MEAQLSGDDAKVYSKLYVSRRDIVIAQYCAGVLLKRAGISNMGASRNDL